MIQTVFSFKAVSAHLPILFIIINSIMKDEGSVDRAVLYSKMYQLLCGSALVRIVVYIAMSYIWPVVAYYLNYVFYFNRIAQKSRYQFD